MENKIRWGITEFSFVKTYINNKNESIINIFFKNRQNSIFFSYFKHYSQRHTTNIRSFYVPQGNEIHRVIAEFWFAFTRRRRTNNMFPCTKALLLAHVDFYSLRTSWSRVGDSIRHMLRDTSCNYRALLWRSNSRVRD